MHLVFAVLLAVTQQWLVVSDLHVNPFDRDTNPSYYKRDTNWTLFDSTLAQMRKVAPAPQVVIVDGDFLAHHFEQLVQSSGHNENVATAALQTMTRIERSFARTFPHAQFLIAMGNNDDPCGDYRTAPDTPYLAQLARIWAPLVNRNGAAPGFSRDFSHLGSYVARLPASLRAIVVDDVYWSLFFQPCGRGAAGMPYAEINWFAKALTGVPAGQRGLIVLHIPPGIDSSSTLLAHRFLVVPFWQNDTRNRFMALLGANAARIALVVAGHTHRTDFRLASGVPILVAPAISPVYANNPAFLSLQLAKDGTLNDYRMYAYDLDGQKWSRIFDFDGAYDVDGFTSKALSAAHARIDEDPAVRERWMSSLVANSDYDVRGSWREFWCAQTDFAGDYAACAGAARRVFVLPAALALAGSVVVLAIILFVVRLARQRRRA